MNEHTHQEYDNFIREALTSTQLQYRDPERTKQDMLEVLLQYPGLKPVTENYVFYDGMEQLLLALSGTIPIHHKGHVYYIPVIIWLLNTYPYNAPMAFVKPTPDMRIKVSSNVAPDGKVSLPYLQEWKHNSSELILLIQVLIITFQDEPPVYSVFSSPPPTVYPISPSNSLYNNPYHQPMSPQRATLLRSVEEKVIFKLMRTYQSTIAETKAAEQLRQGSEKLSMMLQRIENEKQVLEEDILKCQQQAETLDNTIAENEAEIAERESMPIEEAIGVKWPLYNQIVQSNAEDQALEDAIYFVSEGLRSGRMELDQFEKNIRKLARRQFMLRVLIRNCQNKSGLSTGLT